MEPVVYYLLLTHLLCITMEISYAEIRTLGPPLLPGQRWSAGTGPTIWIDLATRLPPAVAVRWRLYSTAAHRPVRLQLWRPLAGSDGFTLVAEHRVVPTSIGLVEYDLPVDERVHVKETDKLGFTNEMGDGPVAYQDTPWRDAAEPAGHVGVTWAEVSMMPQVGSVYRMSHLEPERRYSLNLDVVTCLSEWSIVDVHCVQFVQSAANWSQAGGHCEGSGGHLVTPKSWTFASSLRRAMVLQGMTQTWLGLSYNDTTSYFTWMDQEGGDIYSIHQWAHADSTSKQLCVALTQLGHWATVNCSHRSPFICQNNEGNVPENLYNSTTTVATTPTTSTTTITPTTSTSSTSTTSTSTSTTTTTIPTSTTTTQTQVSTDDGLSNKPTGTVHKEGCDEVTTWSRGQACLSDSDRLILGQALGENRSLSADIGLMETVSRNSKQHGITVLDLILLNGMLDAILEDNSFQRTGDSEEEETQAFVQSLADATDTVLSYDCNCTDAWRKMRKLHEGPLDTVRRLEGLLHTILRHVTSRRDATAVEATRSGLDIHIETMNKKNLTFYRKHLEGDIDIVIPDTFFRNSTDQVGVSTVVLKHSDNLVSLGPNHSPENASLNSQVISITIHPPHDDTSDVWFAFRVQHSKPINRSYQAPLCVFWDYTSPEGWSTKGCRVTHYHENATVCECNHLTNFAVLMQSFDFKISEADKRALSVVTYAGCTLSIVGLLATLLTHLICRCFSERGRILVNLCLALLAAYILFIFGIDRAGHPNVCKLVAIGLHYFYLAAFFWMLAQGIELYSKLRIVFMQRSKIVHYSILGWGIPAIIVAVAVAMRFEDYGRDEFCWLSLQTGLVWSFICPVVIIVLANFCVLCFVLNTFRQPRPGKESGFRHPNSKSRRSAARAALILMPVLGLTWILGLMSVNEHTVMFQYLFAACNSSQGFLIFILHCVLNEEVRASCRRHVTRGRLDSFRSDLSHVTRSDLRSVSSSNSGLPRQGATPAHGSYPKSILRPTHSTTSSLTTNPRTACPQSSILSDSSVDSGSLSSDTWDNRTSRLRMLGLGYLLPGRSKRVVITDPKKVKARLKDAHHKPK